MHWRLGVRATLTASPSLGRLSAQVAEGSVSHRILGAAPATPTGGETAFDHAGNGPLARGATPHRTPNRLAGLEAPRHFALRREEGGGPRRAPASTSANPLLQPRQRHGLRATDAFVTAATPSRVGTQRFARPSLHGPQARLVAPQAADVYAHLAAQAHDGSNRHAIAPGVDATALRRAYFALPKPTADAIHQLSAVQGATPTDEAPQPSGR